MTASRWNLSRIHVKARTAYIRNMVRDVYRDFEESKARETRNGFTYRLRSVPRAIVVQDSEDGAFRLVQYLCLCAHGSGGGGEVLLPASAQIAGNAILLILLVYPDCSHYRRDLRDDIPHARNSVNNVYGIVELHRRDKINRVTIKDCDK